jgi:hypothetical protein
LILLAAPYVLKKILCFIYRNRNNVKEFFAGIVDEECANKKEKKEKKEEKRKKKKKIAQMRKVQTKARRPLKHQE